MSYILFAWGITNIIKFILNYNLTLEVKDFPTQMHEILKSNIVQYLILKFFLPQLLIQWGCLGWCDAGFVRQDFTVDRVSLYIFKCSDYILLIGNMYLLSYNTSSISPKSIFILLLVFWFDSYCPYTEYFNCKLWSFG